MAKESVGVGEQLIELVGRAKPEDLASVDQLIVEKEKELAGLRAVRKVLAIALGVEEEKKPGPRKVAATHSAPASQKPSTTEERRAMCCRYIAKNGPTTGSALCRLFDIPTGSQTGVFDHEWFNRTDRGYELTMKGHDAAKRLAAGGVTA